MEGIYSPPRGPQEEDWEWVEAPGAKGPQQAIGAAWDGKENSVDKSEKVRYHYQKLSTYTMGV